MAESAVDRRSQTSTHASTVCYVPTMRRLTLLALVVSVLAVPSVALVSGSEPSVAWPQFRGPAGDGILGEGKLPTKWSANDNVVWGVEIKGRGQCAHGVRIGSPPLTALERPDGVAGQTGPLGQLLLGESGGLPQCPESLREGAHPTHRLVHRW